MAPNALAADARSRARRVLVALGTAAVAYISAQVASKISHSFVGETIPTTALRRAPVPRSVARLAEEAAGGEEGEEEEEELTWEEEQEKEYQHKLKTIPWFKTWMEHPDDSEKPDPRGQIWYFNKTERRPPKMRNMGIILDGDLLDNLPMYYQEGLLGKGGPPTGFVKELVLRTWYNEFWPSGWSKQNFPERYSGPYGEPCEADYELAYEKMKKAFREGTPMVGKDDGKGWIWLCATQLPYGVHLFTTMSVPYGQRVLALVKKDDPDEFFQNVDWWRIHVRLNSPALWGVTASKFPFPFFRQKVV